MIPVGWVKLVSTDPPRSILVRLSDARPNVTAGYGGWQEIARPRRSPLSVWQGSPGLRMDLPLQFDSWQQGSGTQQPPSIEKDLGALEAMATPTASDGSPPRITLQATGGLLPHKGKHWVIDSLNWGDALANANGDRVRQQVTVSLLEYIADTRVVLSSAANRQRAKTAGPKTKQGASVKRYTVKKGDTLSAIAARLLGKASRWTEIATLNKLRDPHRLSVGQVLRLP